MRYDPDNHNWIGRGILDITKGRWVKEFDYFQYHHLIYTKRLRELYDEYD